MSLKYRDVTGKETPIAGLNGLSGELVPSVSYYQKGSVTIPSGAVGDEISIPITLGTAMPDADYVVDFSNYGTAVAMSYASKTKAGFSVQVRYFRAVAGAYNATYQAFKLMTDESRAIDEAAIATNTADIATIKSNLATVMADCTLSGISFGDSSGYLKAQQCGKIVNVIGHSLTFTVAGLTWVTVATLPSTITKPSVPVLCAIVAVSGDTVLVSIATSGNIQVFNPSEHTSNYYGLNITYMVA